jgi:polysaccharide pyruvyl transferase CsaB
MGNYSKELEALESPSYTVVVSGYYGFHNSGDEAVLQSILLALQSEAEQHKINIKPIVLSIDPEFTRKQYGVQAVHRMKLSEVKAAIQASNGLISGGGSLLQDATGFKSIPYYLAIVRMAQWLGKPTFIYSQGIGPVNRKLFYPMIRHVFNRSQYVSVRDKESAELLGKIGVKRNMIQVVPDPVMGLPLKGTPQDSAPRRSLDKPLIGISVRFWNKDRSDLNRLAEGLRSIAIARPVRFQFLPFHLPSDQEASQYIIDRLQNVDNAEVVIHGGTEDPQEMLAEVSHCDLLIGMRLHSLIYAANVQVPVMGISYDPKINHFLHRLGLTASATTEQFNVLSFVEEALRLLDNKQQWQQDKASMISELKSQSQQPAQQIVQYLRLQK